PSPRAPILDLNPDDWIDELDLLRFLSGWHNRVYPGNGDHNQDGVVDRLDVFAFVNDWKRRNQIRADFNKDGVVDQKDALLFIEAWHTNYVRDVGEPLE
ncbi:MAG TPA: GC-type dockerin domain-anchored protein, partial [bacterium]|nr:GC-type dockerin domain-anchored protein [bacterium]